MSRQPSVAGGLACLTLVRPAAAVASRNTRTCRRVAKLGSSFCPTLAPLLHDRRPRCNPVAGERLSALTTPSSEGTGPTVRGWVVVNNDPDTTPPWSLGARRRSRPGSAWSGAVQPRTTPTLRSQRGSRRRAGRRNQPDPLRAARPGSGWGGGDPRAVGGQSGRGGPVVGAAVGGWVGGCGAAAAVGGRSGGAGRGRSRPAGVRMVSRLGVAGAVRAGGF